MNKANNKNLIKKKDARKEFSKSGDKKLKKTTYNQKIIIKRIQVIFSQSQNLNLKDKYKNENEIIIKTKLTKGEPRIIIMGKKTNK
jgi:hypothetical protein